MTHKGSGGELAVRTLIDRYLEATAKGRRTGNYRTMAQSALERWVQFLEQREQATLDALDVDIQRAYAQRLRQAYRDGDIAASTARTYYATVRACLEWAVEDGLLTTNPAAPSRVTTELPTESTETDRQFWSPGDVKALLSYLSERIDTEIEAGGLTAAAKPVRDRALVSVLAFTGVRGAEICRDTDDERPGRQGLRWQRVDLEDGTMKVLGKSQRWEWAQVPKQARSHLERHRRVQKPPTDSWPVFPTGHAPSKYAAVRSQLADRGWEANAIEQLLDAEPIDEILIEHEIVPPAITVRGARTVMKRLCTAADVDIDGEYLKPHGARRGLGDLLYRESAELAQSTLRHTSIRTTHEAYSHVDASKTADTVSKLIENEHERSNPESESDSNQVDYERR